jgi:hypothetical protein
VQHSTAQPVITVQHIKQSTAHTAELVAGCGLHQVMRGDFNVVKCLLIAVVGLADWRTQCTLLALLPAEVVCQEGRQL